MITVCLEQSEEFFEGEAAAQVAEICKLGSRTMATFHLFQPGLMISNLVTLR